MVAHPVCGVAYERPAFDNLAHGLEDAAGHDERGVPSQTPPPVARPALCVSVVLIIRAVPESR